MRFLQFIALSALALATSFAVAAEGENTLTAAERFSFADILKKARFTYSGLLEGPRLDHMDGNLDGRGTFLQIKNYLNADYEVAPNWRVELNGEFRQYFRPVDPRRPDRGSFEWRDPSIGIARRNLFERGNFALAARMRYALPVTQDTKGRVGRAFDTGRGSIYVQAVPVWRFRDGTFTLTCPVESYINLPKGEAPNREQFSVKAKVQLAYQLAKKWAARAEYSTGDLRRAHDGKWSNINERSLGHKVMAGAAYAPVREVVLNPSVTWGRGQWRLNQPEVSLFASYNFL